MNKDMIKRAFEFYGIDDKEYFDNCIKALNLINNNSNIKETVLKLMDILFVNYEDSKFDSIINMNYKETFNTDNVYIPNVIVLLAHDIHIKSIEKFDELNKQININHVKHDLEFYRNGMPLRHTTWMAHLIRGMILEIGCLEYQIMEIPYMGCKVKIHIPRGTDFSISNIKDSFDKSKEYIKKYYGIENPKYFCNSWMLSSTTKKCLSKDSNIYKFSELFDIKEEYESLDVLRFVFSKQEDDYTKLEENTSLQRKFKSMLINKEKLYNGIGILK